MEGWKDGRMEGWKDGRMEEWKSGRVEEWKNGGMEGWSDGVLEWWRLSHLLSMLSRKHPNNCHSCESRNLKSKIKHHVEL
jgi:hypothetical protein